jgi:hypothetical protein
MITIIMNDDKSLRKTITNEIYVGESGESLTLLLPQVYNNYSLENYSINFNWINSINQGDIILATKLNECRSGYLQYNIPIPIKMTESVGDITVWIEIVDTNGILIKSGTTTILISSHLKISDYLTDSQLSLIELHEVKMEQYNFEFTQKLAQITDKYNKTLEVAKLVTQMLKDMEEIEVRINERN